MGIAVYHAMVQPLSQQNEPYGSADKSDAEQHT